MNAMRINNISKVYGENLTVFQNLSLDITMHESVCIFGPSGCGKTTLMHIIADLEPYIEGSIQFYDENKKIVKNPTIGFVFQEPRLFPWLTVSKNLELVIKKPSTNKAAIDKQINKTLKLVQLEGYNQRHPDELSGGEKQRVALARALIVQPDILLLDEPFSHLDELTAMKLRVGLAQILKRLKITTILATHNPLEAIFLADRIVVLSTQKPTKIKQILTVDIPKPRNKNLYSEFIYNPVVEHILKDLFR